jgi:hypothetical protein
MGDFLCIFPNVFNVRVTFIFGGGGTGLLWGSGILGFKLRAL